MAGWLWADARALHRVGCQARAMPPSAGKPTVPDDFVLESSKFTRYYDNHR
jgi:hypothetical protein